MTSGEIVADDAVEYAPRFLSADANLHQSGVDSASASSIAAFGNFMEDDALRLFQARALLNVPCDRRSPYAPGLGLPDILIGFAARVLSSNNVRFLRRNHVVRNKPARNIDCVFIALCRSRHDRPRQERCILAEVIR